MNTLIKKRKFHSKNRKCPENTKFLVYVPGILVFPANPSVDITSVDNLSEDNATVDDVVLLIKPSKKIPFNE